MKTIDNIAIILQKVLKLKKKPKLNDKSKIGDFKNWDSLSHFIFLMEVEKFFKIKFSTENFTLIKSIKDIKKNLKDGQKTNK